MKMFSFVLLALPLVLCSISTASAQSCGSHNLIASSLYSYFTSPNYPNYYPSSTTCLWTITTSSSYVIELTFIAFDTEGTSAGCSGLGDILEVYNGRYASTSQLLGKYCKNYLPPNVYSSGTALFLKFHSDSSIRKTGFKIKYRAVVPKPDSTICSPFNTYSQNNAIKYSGSSGYIKSPLYGTKYPSNIQCTWVITVPEGKRVKLSFHDFKVDNPSSSYCLYSSYSYDYLEVRDGQYSFSNYLKKLCSSTSPSPIYSTGRYMWIRFKSNSDNYIKTKTTGFNASFTAEQRSTFMSTVMPPLIATAYPTTFSTSSSDKSTRSFTGLVVGVVIGVFVLTCLMVVCACIAKRSSPGHVNVPPPTTQTTVYNNQNPTGATPQYPQQVEGGSVPYPHVGYSQAPHGSYPPPPKGSYPPLLVGSFPPPTGSYPALLQGSYQPPSGSIPPPPTGGGTPAPVGYPLQSSIPMNAYPLRTIQNDPPPPYPGPPSCPPQAATTQQQAAPANLNLSPQGAPADPNPPHAPPQGAPANPNPPPQGAEHQESPLPYPPLQSTAPPQI